MNARYATPIGVGLSSVRSRRRRRSHLAQQATTPPNLTTTSFSSTAPSASPSASKFPTHAPAESPEQVGLSSPTHTNRSDEIVLAALPFVVSTAIFLYADRRAERTQAPAGQRFGRRALKPKTSEARRRSLVVRSNPTFGRASNQIDVSDMTHVGPSKSCDESRAQTAVRSGRYSARHRSTPVPFASGSVGRSRAPIWRVLVLELSEQSGAAVASDYDRPAWHD